jgi:hypothetical protein
MVYEVVDWIHLTQDKNQWWASVNTVMNRWDGSSAGSVPVMSCRLCRIHVRVSTAMCTCMELSPYAPGSDAL